MKKINNKNIIKLENTFSFDVETTHGVGILRMVYETELGIVMGKVFFPDEEIFINYRLSDLVEKFNLTYQPFKMGSQKRIKVMSK